MALSNAKIASGSGVWDSVQLLRTFFSKSRISEKLIREIVPEKSTEFT